MESQPIDDGPEFTEVVVRTGQAVTFPLGGPIEVAVRITVAREPVIHEGEPDIGDELDIITAEGDPDTGGELDIEGLFVSGELGVDIEGLFVSGELGDGRFGYAASPRYTGTTGGALEGAPGNGVLALFEDSPGDGSGYLWLITRPDVTFSTVTINGFRISLDLLDAGEQNLYRGNKGAVPWPDRISRAAGITVRLAERNER